MPAILPVAVSRERVGDTWEDWSGEPRFRPGARPTPQFPVRRVWWAAVRDASP